MMNSKRVSKPKIQIEREDSDQSENNRRLHLVLVCWMLGQPTIDVFFKYVGRHDKSSVVLIPLILGYIFITIPLTFMALGLSQYSRRGCVKIWDASPVWRGIGIAGLVCLCVSALRNIWNCSSFLFYSIHSLESHPPWLRCDPEQNYQKRGCFTKATNRSNHFNCEELFNEEHCNKIPWRMSEQFFHETAMGYNDEDLGKKYRLRLISCGAIIVIAVHVCIRNSMNSLQIFAPFLVYFPTVLHGIMLLKSFTNPGSYRALKLLSRIKLNLLTSPNIWVDMLTCSLDSIGLVYGGLQSFGKLHNFRNASNSEAVFLNMGVFIYTILYTVFLFNMYGILSFEFNEEIEVIMQVFREPNFVSTPIGISFGGMSKIFTFFFFFSNFLITFRNFATQCLVLLSALTEVSLKFKYYHGSSSCFLCIIYFGLYVVSKFSVLQLLIEQSYKFLSLCCTPILAFYSNVFICFFYGVQRFVDDMHFMLGFKPSILWQLSWYFGIFYNLWAAYASTHNFMKASASQFVVYLIIIVVVVSLIPLVYFFTLLLVKWQKKMPLLESFRPLKNWGPREKILKRSRDMFSAHDMTKEYLYRQGRLKMKPSRSS